MHARKSELDLRWLRSNPYRFLLVTEDSVLIATTGPFTPPDFQLFRCDIG